MREGIQKKLEYIGETGCYYLSLLEQGDVPEAFIVDNYDIDVKKGNILSDCTVMDPCAILLRVTGRKYRVVKTDVFDGNADIIIGCFYNENTGFHHFVVLDKEYQVTFDPYGNSRTVAEGHIESYRLFYRG